jgi:hypothetical protein
VFHASSDRVLPRHQLADSRSAWSDYVEQAAACFYARINTPLKLGRRVTTPNAEDFVKGHLKVLAAKLRGDDGWLYEQWPLATLLADLKDIGVDYKYRNANERRCFNAIAM